MFTLTDSAAEAVRALASRTANPDEAGIRIAAKSPGDHQLIVFVSEQPDDTDQVLEVDGARVFLDEEAATSLADKALDAAVTAEGSVAFRVS